MSTDNSWLRLERSVSVGWNWPKINSSMKEGGIYTQGELLVPCLRSNDYPSGVHIGGMRIHVLGSWFDLEKKNTA